MRSSWLVAFVFLGCGGAPSTPSTITPSAASASATPVAVSPRASLNFPAKTALAVSLDLSKLGADDRKAVSMALGALGIADVYDALDTSRPVQVAVFAYDDAATKGLDTLRTDPATGRELITNAGAALADLPYVMAFRALGSAKDPAAFRTAVDTALRSSGFTAHGDRYADKYNEIRVSMDGKSFAIDSVGVSEGGSSKKGFAAIDEATQQPAEPPKSDGVVHAVITPRAVAYLGFALGLTITKGAVSGESLDEGQRQRIFTEGRKEAAMSFEDLVFDRFDVTADIRGGAPDLVVRTTPNASFRGPSPAALAATPSVEASGYTARLSVSKEMDTWLRPLVTKGASSFYQRAREAGVVGGFLAKLPLSLLVVARLDIMGAGHGAIPEDVSAFDRFGVLENGKDQAFFGLLPEKASDADAKKLAATLKPKTGSVAHAGKRIVILQGNGTLPKELTLVDRPAMSITVRKDTLAGDTPLGAWFGNKDRLVGTVTPDDRAFVIKLGAP